MNNDQPNKPNKRVSNQLSKLSRNDLCKRDIYGRNILHIVILVNRPDYLKQLLKNPNINSVISSTDYENGWNCLHYALFLKNIKCANILINRNHDLLVKKDKENLTPLELLENDMKQFNRHIECVTESGYKLARRLPSPGPDSRFGELSNCGTEDDWFSRSRGVSEILVYGSNRNNNLGLGDSDDRLHPTKLNYLDFKDSLELEKSRFRDIRIAKGHTVILTTEGELFSCGVGSKGRLGHGNNNSLFKFKKIRHFDEERTIIDKIATSDDLNLALSTEGGIFAWGSNKFNQLGYGTDRFEEFSNSPRRILGGELRKSAGGFIGVTCSNIHSIAYTETEIFSWGLNIGQMGVGNATTASEVMKYGSYKGFIQTPKKLDFKYGKIKCVEVNDNMMIVVNDNDEVHAYFNSGHTKLSIPSYYMDISKHFDYFKPKRLTSKFIIKKCILKNGFLAILLNNGNILNVNMKIDHESHPKRINESLKVTDLWKARKLHLRAVDMDIGSDGSVILATRIGSVYNKKAGTNKFKILQKMNRISRVACDPTFSTFGLLRDEIDLLPVALEKNKLVLDLGYLSPLCETDLLRKQTDILNDEVIDSVTTDYIFSSVLEADDEDEEIKHTTSDMLKNWVLKRYDSKFNKEPKIPSLYSQPDLSYFFQLFKSDAEYLKFYFTSNEYGDKNYDYSIKINDVILGVHKGILASRSSVLKKMLTLEVDQIKSESVIISNNRDDEYIEFSNVELKSVLILIHYIYTNNVISIWDDYPLGKNCPVEIRDTRSQFHDLCSSLHLFDGLGSSLQFPKYLECIKHSYENSEFNDLKVILEDGEVELYSAFLLARSGFFETTLSRRWTNEKSIQLPHITKDKFDILLRYIHGYNIFELFDEYQFTDINEFINFVLDIIELADELLVLNLKKMCELTIKDLISMENVMLILEHSWDLNCSILYYECVWFIYNNLEVVVYDKLLEEYSNDLISSLEGDIKLLASNKRDGCYNPLWMEESSESLLNEFCNDLEEYNRHFMRDDIYSFAPLFDIKNEAKKEQSKNSEGQDKQRKKSFVEGSNKTSRSLSSSSSSPSILAATRNSIVTFDSAIDDEGSSPDEFQVVSNRRRRSSARKSETILPTTDSERRSSSSTPVSIPFIPSSGSSSSSLNKLATPRMNLATASIAVPVPTLAPTPTIQREWPQLNDKGSGNLNNRPIFAQPRLSQKERLKQATSRASPVEQSSPKTAPWSAKSPSNSASPPSSTGKSPWASKETPNTQATKQSSSKFPKISATSMNKVYSTPSLTEVMLQQEYGLEIPKPQKSAKSLLEIQQEQEFAKWWEEESKKVQGSSSGSSKGPEAKTGGKSKKKHAKKEHLNGATIGDVSNLYPLDGPETGTSTSSKKKGKKPMKKEILTI